jgi:DUF4097 and DUF4098 domain-containing protein YvlB
MNTVNRFPVRNLAIVVSAAALVFPLTVLADQDIEKTLDIPPDGIIMVDNTAGMIEFDTWDNKNQVQVRGEAGDAVEEIEITSNSKGVQIRVHNRKATRNTDDTDLYLRIPATVSIEANGVSTDITVTGSRGESITLETVSGDLEVEASPQRIELHSVSGDVEFSGETKRSTVETVSGEITIVGAGGEVSLSTVSGDVTLEGGALTRGRFESVSGDLNLELDLDDGGRLSCDSMSGDVNLLLPSSQKAEFTAQSYSGGIQTDFGESSSVSEGPGVMLEHRQGDNGAQVRLETFSGDITIRAQ